MAELVTFENVYAVLQSFADELRDAYKAELRKSDRKASEKLINSIVTKVVTGEHSISVELHLEHYWRYVEYDTHPHFPPISAIQKWVEIKPVIPTPDEKGRIPTPRQLAYLIARKISREGTKGSHDLEHTMSDVWGRFREAVAEAARKDVETFVVKVWRA